MKSHGQLSDDISFRQTNRVLNQLDIICLKRKQNIQFQYDLLVYMVNYAIENKTEFMKIHIERSK